MTNAVTIAQQGSNNTTFRNRIINGAMVIDQRNAGASVTIGAGDQYTLDRWFGSGSITSKFSVQQSTTSTTGFVNSLLITSLAATTPGSGDQYRLEQRIEGFNCADLAWGTASAVTVTLSFWVRCSLTGTFGGAIVNSAGNRSYPFSFTISSANTFEYKTITITGDTTGTWLTNNGIGIALRFSLGVGSTFQGTANTWAAANYIAPTGATNLVGTNGATLYITGVQLEAGSTASPFEYRLYGTELALCQRYLPAFSADATGYRLPGSGICYSTTQGYVTLIYPQTTRVPATGITVSSASHFTVDLDGVTAPTATALSFASYSSLNAARIQMTVASGMTTGYPFFLTISNSSGRIYFTGCEL